MTIKLASLKANVEREEKGDWVAYPDWPGVEFNVSSLHSPAFKSAHMIMNQRFARIYKGKPVPAEKMQEELGKLYCKHILHGWRGIDEAYTPDLALDTLCDLSGREILEAVSWCANKISELQVEFVEDAAKNSERPFGTDTSRKARTTG